MNASSQDVYYQTDSPTTADSLSQVIVNKILTLAQSTLKKNHQYNTRIITKNQNKCI